MITAEDVHAVERAYVAAGARRLLEPADGPGARSIGALACAGAVASHFLAVGAPRSLALVGDDPEIAASLEAHRTWFAPRDVRCTSAAVAAAAGGRVVTLAEALAADIVCIHVALALTAPQLRRGTHVNALAEVALDAELAALAHRHDEARGLPALAAGLVDGRELDELTIFLAPAAPIAAASLGATPT